MPSLLRFPLSQFLQHSRQLLKVSVEASKPVHLVTGNEAADLDSFVSSVLYAYLASDTAATSPQLIPVLPIPRADLSLRPEFLHLLKELQLSSNHLLYLEDLPPREGHSDAGKNEVTLVDHNVLQERIFAPERTIVRAIIDHHKDEGYHLDAKLRIIKTAGSCASLVTGWGKGEWPSGDDGRDIAKLALAPILVDTANITQRVTEHDSAAVKFLERKLREIGDEAAVEVADAGSTGASDPSFFTSSEIAAWDSSAFFTALNEAKMSLDGLSLKDILRKDYKEWFTESTPALKLGISSVVKPLSYLISSERGGKDEFLSALKGWAAERNLDVVAVMTAFTNEEGEFSRELLLWAISDEAKNVGYMTRFSKWAQSKEGEKLALAELQISGERGGGLEDMKTEQRRVWKQRNTEMSRKQVAWILIRWE
ncbi:hypothetical protein BDZ91DRAFT_655669 [Kalaharituber pfeilii]|nr:hypothetical protein BDZ91DRAFT_655669 [Kalaharituber pfeilii]